jgi:alkylated DNA nucleotide flippase Atl1
MDEHADKTVSWWRRVRDYWRAQSRKAARMEQGLQLTNAEGHAYGQVAKLQRGKEGPGALP